MAEASDNISRRDVLKTTGAAAVAAAVLGAPGPAVAKIESDRKIRVGVVGGGFGCSFQWHLHPNCTVQAVSDLRPDRRKHLQQVYKCPKAYPSLEKLVLDKDIEAVAVFTGAPDHVRHVLEVMKTGKHCLCAVPAGLTLEEMGQLKEIKERTGLKYMMAETSYYRAPCILARQYWKDGKFGNFLYSEVEYYHPSIGADRDGLSREGGKKTWRYGYPPMLYPTHSTGFHVGVTHERMTKVSCAAWRGRDKAFQDNAYDNPFASMSALMTTSGDNICRCNVFWHGHGHGERAQWMGEAMSVFMPGWAGQPFVVKTRGKPDVRACPDFFDQLPPPMRVGTGHGNSHTFITHEFLAALVAGREPAVDVYEAIAMTAPGIVAMQSARKGGEQLKVPSFDRT